MGFEVWEGVARSMRGLLLRAKLKEIEGNCSYRGSVAKWLGGLRLVGDRIMRYRMLITGG